MFTLSSCCSSPTAEGFAERCTAPTVDSTIRVKSFPFSHLHDEAPCRTVLSVPLNFFAEEAESIQSQATTSSASNKQNEYSAIDADGNHRRCSISGVETNFAETSKALKRRGSVFSSSLSVQLDATLPYHTSKVDAGVMENIDQNDTDAKSSWLLSSPFSEKLVGVPFTPQALPLSERSITSEGQLPKDETFPFFENTRQYTSFTPTMQQRNWNRLALDRSPTKEPRWGGIVQEVEDTILSSPNRVILSSLKVSNHGLLEDIPIDLIVDEERLQNDSRKLFEDREKTKPLVPLFSESGVQAHVCPKSCIAFEKNPLIADRGRTPFSVNISECQSSDSGVKEEKKGLQSLLKKPELPCCTKNFDDDCEDRNSSASRDWKCLEEDGSQCTKRHNSLSTLEENQVEKIETGSIASHQSEVKSVGCKEGAKRSKELTSHPFLAPFLTSPARSASPTSSVSSSCSSFPLRSERSPGEKCFPLSELVARLPLSQEELEEMERRKEMKQSRKGPFQLRNENDNGIMTGQLNPRLESAIAASSPQGHGAQRHTQVLHDMLGRSKIGAHLRKTGLTNPPSSSAAVRSKEKLISHPSGKHEPFRFPHAPRRSLIDLADVLHECNFLGMRDIMASVSASSSVELHGEGVTPVIESDGKQGNSIPGKEVPSHTGPHQAVESGKPEAEEKQNSASSTFLPLSTTTSCSPLAADCSSSSFSHEGLRGFTASSREQAATLNSPSRLTPKQALYLAAAMTERELHESAEPLGTPCGTSSEWEKMTGRDLEVKSGVPRHVDFFSLTQPVISALSSPICSCEEDTLSFPFISGVKPEKGGLLIPPQEVLDPLEHKFISESPQSIALRQYSPRDSTNINAYSPRGGPQCNTAESAIRYAPRLGQSSDSCSKRLASSRCAAMIMQNSLYGSDRKGVERYPAQDGGPSAARSSLSQNRRFSEGEIIYVLKREGEDSLRCRSFHDELFRVKDLIRYAARVEEASWNSFRGSETELST